MQPELQIIHLTQALRSEANAIDSAVADRDPERVCDALGRIETLVNDIGALIEEETEYA